MEHENYATSLSKLQHAIIDNQPDVALELLGRKTPSLPARLNAYIQGYRIRLRKTVENDYPTLKYYLGDEALHKLIAEYVERTPSSSYTIDQYPIGFSEYIAKSIDDPAAISIAVLEAAISQVFWLPDSEAFIPTADFSMEQLFTLKLECRAASMLLKISVDAESYLTALRRDEKPSMNNTPCYLMIIRHENEVKRHRLSEVEYTLLCAIKNHPFAEAMEIVTNNNPQMAEAIGTHLSEWLMKWITNGFFKAKGP